MYLAASSSGRALLGHSSRGCARGKGGLDGILGELELALGLFGRGVPVVDHLESKNGVEGETGDKSIKDELVVDLLEGREDTGERASEVVEDLIAC